MWPPIEEQVPAPYCFLKMVSLAKLLYKKFAFVRINFIYVIKGHP